MAEMTASDRGIRTSYYSALIIVHRDVFVLPESHLTRHRSNPAESESSGLITDEWDEPHPTQAG